MSVITEGISEREKIIRKKFYAGAELSYEDCQYLIGVIHTLRWDRKLLRNRLEAAYSITTKALAEPPDQGSGTLVEIATTLEACSEYPPLCTGSPDGQHHVVPTIHWLVDGVPQCEGLGGTGKQGVEVSSPFDENVLKITCRSCIVHLQNLLAGHKL